MRSESSHKGLLWRSYTNFNISAAFIRNMWIIWSPPLLSHTNISLPTILNSIGISSYSPWKPPHFTLVITWSVKQQDLIILTIDLSLMLAKNESFMSLSTDDKKNLSEFSKYWSFQKLHAQQPHNQRERTQTPTGQWKCFLDLLVFPADRFLIYLLYTHIIFGKIQWSTLKRAAFANSYHRVESESP